MSLISELTPVNYVLMSGIVWLSGVFIWLIRKFVRSYEQNTTTMTRVSDTLQAVDRKLDTAAERDLEISKTLAAIHARGNFPAAVRVVSDKK